MKYIRNGYVTTSLGDVGGNLSLLGAAEIIQDAVCMALGIIGCDNISLRDKYNSMWVFTKNKILLFNKLKWNEEYRVESYICKITKITIVFETIIYKKNNEVCYISKIEACSLDKETKRIKRIKDVGIPLDFVCDSSVLSFDFDKYSQFNGELLRNVLVESTNLDMSMHCNNTEYVRLLSNCYNAMQLSNMPLKEFSIYYTKETKEGANLEVYRESSNCCDLFEIKHNDEVCVKAVFRFEGNF